MWDLPDVQAGNRKGRGTRDQIARLFWMIEKAKEVPENYRLLLHRLLKSLWLCGLQKLWKIFKEMGIPGHLTCLLRNLYVGQEATVRTLHGTTDWFKIGKVVWQGYKLPPCLFNWYVECIMQNARMDEAQLESRLLGEINNLRHAEDTTLMAESEEEPKSLLMRVEEESKNAGLKLNIQKLRSWQSVLSLLGK